MAPLLKELVPILKRFGEIDVTDEVEEKLLNISPATVDRLLKPVKERAECNVSETMG